MRSYPGMRQLPLDVRSEFSLMFLLEHVFPKSNLIKHRREQACARAARNVEQGGKGKVIAVERVRSLSPERFRDHYLSKGIPVLLEGGAEAWPLMESWTFENLQRKFGDAKIKLVQRKGLSDDDFVDSREFSEEVLFSEFLEQVLHGGRKYMRFAPLFEQFPELLSDFDHGFFKRMVSRTWGMSFQMFIGGEGTFTPLHNAITPFFFLNVRGTKRWALIPSHYLALLQPAADGDSYNHSAAEVDLSNVESFPGFDCVDRMEALMQPGDLLYVPSWMWHCVQNEAPTIGVRCTFMYPKGMLAESLTLSFIRVFLARNPSALEWLYYSVFKTNLPSRDKMLLTPKWTIGLPKSK